MNDIIRLRELRQQKKGCAQIMVQMALEANRDENPALVQSMFGLCGGMHSGLLCGALSGAACMMSYFDPQLAATEMIPQLLDWFREEYDGKLGCMELLDGDRVNCPRICPALIENVYLEAKEILEEYGFDMTSAFEEGN